ncbi:YedE-related selenium metabolism membrane protein [Candidatus Desantisbacteria bacterium]|nr:YedE-related selenium metabolism membrane protein [Candidatus Desantisbacteria bacterium]
MKKFIKQEKLVILITGLLIGIFGVFLFVWGNPPHTGICVSCFLENVSGALGLHNNSRMQFLRPEIMGLVFGSFITALINKEFRSTAGNTPLISFLLGMLMIIGSSVFIGCPIKLMTRIGGGELTALIGLIGLIIGIWIGIQFIRDGFTLGEKNNVSKLNGFIIPFLILIFTIFLFIKPFFIYFSKTGPGSLHAPILISLVVSLFIGGLAQRSRFCVTGSIRNFLLAGDTLLLQGLFMLLLGAIIISILTNNFEIILYRTEFQNEYLWGFLGMLLVGWASVYAGGCPFRQLILAGEGDTDAGICILGMLFGGAIVQNFFIKTTSSGITVSGQISVLSGFIFLIITGLLLREKT